MRTPSYASLAVAASALAAIVSAADLDPIVVKGSSKCPITTLCLPPYELLLIFMFLLQNSSSKAMALNCKATLIQLPVASQHLLTPTLAL